MGSLTGGAPEVGWPEFPKVELPGVALPTLVRDLHKPSCYLGGPIRGVSGWEYRFRECQVRLEALGWKVWSPLQWIEKTGQQPGVDADDRQGMADDIAAMAQQDALMLMEGWPRSRGATAERAVAIALEIPIYYESLGWPRA